MIGKMTPAQQVALARIAGALPSTAYLAGGVAVALRLTHRTSVDLDFFVPDIDPLVLVDSLVELGGVKVTSRASGTVYLEVDGVPVSIIRYRYPLLAKPEHLAGVAIPVAEFVDLICMKLSAISNRGAVRDFWDLHAMLTITGQSLAQAIEAFQQKYVSEDVGHVVRSLVYFVEADAEPMPSGLEPGHWAVIKEDFRQWVVAL